MTRFLFISIIGLTIGLTGCERENISTDPAYRLSFSTDTVRFDTVFTAIGSSTRYLKVYNRNRFDIRISSIHLAKGGESPYRINIDGVAANRVENVNLRRNDSLFIFVEVTIDPNNQNSPLLVADSIVFNTNGNIQDVKLIAWGQDVHMLKSRVFTTDIVLQADKPYLILDSLWVSPNTVLTINAGCRLHFHNLAQLRVAGSLKVMGEPESKVVFEGDRLEKFYRDKAGQWGGIWLRRGSRDNEIRWAEIRNGIIGLIVDTCVTDTGPTLTLHNTIIENMSAAGLYTRGSRVVADNCLISNAGQISVALTMGGEYCFYHCTIANYWGQYIYRTGPALLLNNYYTYQLVKDGPILVMPRDLVMASFTNCIIYGSRESEFEVDNVYKDETVNALMNYRFDHCILRVPQGFNLSDPQKYIEVIRKDPRFKSPYDRNFELDTLSPAKDVGLMETAQKYPIDLKGISRLTDLGPDLGAYERKER